MSTAEAIFNSTSWQSDHPEAGFSRRKKNYRSLLTRLEDRITKAMVTSTKAIICKCGVYDRNMYNVIKWIA